MKHLKQLLILLLGTVLLTACADQKDTASSCLTQLDAEKYQAVADNPNCSNYERASGYLGLAGLSFTNFMKAGATDNLTKTLGISKLDNASDYTPGTGKRKYLTKALCLVGPDNITTSSRCSGLTTRSGSRSNSDMELSMFALIGDLIYVNYGVLDNDSNGTITTTETDSFSSLSTSGVNSKGGGTAIVYDNSTYEIVTSSNSYIADSALISSSGLGSYCLTFTDNYTIIPSSSNGGDNCTNYLSSATEIRPIYKVDNMTDISGGSVAGKITALVSEFTNLSTSLDGELGNIGLSSGNSLRTSLTESLSKIDNGGKDKNGNTCTEAEAFDVVHLLVKTAADNNTNKSDYKNYNMISLTDLLGNVNSNIPSPSFSGYTINKARLIWDASTSDNTTYTDSYEAAHSDLYTAVKNIRAFGTETSTKGDGKVIFRELLCIGEN